MFADHMGRLINELVLLSITIKMHVMFAFLEFLAMLIVFCCYLAVDVAFSFNRISSKIINFWMEFEHFASFHWWLYCCLI